MFSGFKSADDLQFVKSFESSQDLSSDFPDHRNGKEGLIF